MSPRRHSDATAATTPDATFAAERPVDLPEEGAVVAGAMRLVHATPTLIAMWDTGLRCVFSNAAHDRFFGYAPGSMVGTHLRDLLGAAAADIEADRIRGVLAGTPQRFTAAVPNADRESRDLEVVYVPDEVSGGFSVAASDVTQRVTALRTLRHAEMIAELGSWTAVDLHRPWFSPSLYRLVGRDPTEWTPSWADIMEQVHPDERERVIGAVTEHWERRESYELEYRLVQPAGDVRTLRSRCDVEIRPDGSVHRHGTELDITDLRRAQDTARVAHDRVARLAQTQADLIALIGHDAKQPLTVIRGHLSNLEEEWDDVPEDYRRRGLSKAASAARRLDRLLDEVLAMARLESLGDEEVPTSPRQLLVADVLAQVVEELSDPEGVTVTVTGRPTAYVDPWQLRQMLTNLTSNAVKYGTVPVVVSARTLAEPAPADTRTDAQADSRLGTRVEIRVEDSGEGVPASFLPRLFGRFERAEEGIAATKSGNGFGLYIVKRLAAANGGSVRYEPGASGGACFVLELPTG